MFDLVPGMELTPTNPMTLKPHALKSPAQVGLLSFFFVFDFCSASKWKRIGSERNGERCLGTWKYFFEGQKLRVEVYFKAFCSIVFASEQWDIYTQSTHPSSFVNKGTQTSNSLSVTLHLFQCRCMIRMDFFGSNLRHVDMEERSILFFALRDSELILMVLAHWVNNLGKCTNF